MEKKSKIKKKKYKNKKKDFQKIVDSFNKTQKSKTG